MSERFLDEFFPAAVGVARVYARPVWEFAFPESSRVCSTPEVSFGGQVIQWPFLGMVAAWGVSCGVIGAWRVLKMAHPISTFALTSSIGMVCYSVMSCAAVANHCFTARFPKANTLAYGLNTGFTGSCALVLVGAAFDQEWRRRGWQGLSLVVALPAVHIVTLAVASAVRGAESRVGCEFCYLGVTAAACAAFLAGNWFGYLRPPASREGRRALQHAILCGAGAVACPFLLDRWICAASGSAHFGAPTIGFAFFNVLILRWSVLVRAWDTESSSRSGSAPPSPGAGGAVAEGKAGGVGGQPMLADRWKGKAKAI